MFSLSTLICNSCDRPCELKFCVSLYLQVHLSSARVDKTGLNFQVFLTVSLVLYLYWAFKSVKISL